MNSKVTPQPLAPVLNNPTILQRRQMLYNSLINVNRLEDYSNIIDLLSPPTNITNYGTPGEFKNMKVGIIGGGLAGMSAAFELRKLGYEITIFDPITDRVGGRVYTYYFDKDKKLYGELGAMRIPVSHETTWHYIDLFKLNTEAFIQGNPNTFTYVRGVRVRNNPKDQNIFNSIYPKFDLTIQERNTPWPQLYDNVAKYYLSTLPPNIRKQFLMVLPRYDYRYEFIQNMSGRQAMTLYGLSDEAINLISSVMPLLGSRINTSYETILNEDYSLDFMNLYKISGGTVNLPLAFYNSLMSQNPKEYHGILQNTLGNIKWKGGCLVSGIFKSDKGSQVTLRYESTNDSSEMFENFDYVICSAPFAVLRAMEIEPNFSGRKMQAISEVYYDDAQKTLFLCSERFWEKQGIKGGSSYTDEIIETIGYPSDHAYCTQQNTVNCSPNEPGVLLASYNINEDAYTLGNAPPEYRFRIIKRQVEKVHGFPRGSLNNLILNTKTVDWIRELWFLGAFQMFLPGQKKDFLYVSSIPEYDNRVFFAGEHSSPKNGWMQGALQTGMLAANNVAYYSSINKHQK